MCGLKYRKVITVTYFFQKFLDEYNLCVTKSEGRKPNKIWIEKGSEFYNRLMKSWLSDNDIEMH